MISGLSECLLKFPTKENGVRYCAKQMLGDNVCCSEGIVECKSCEFCCLIVNLNGDEVEIEQVPRLESISLKEYKPQRRKIVRVSLLNGSLRLGYLREGSEDIRKIVLNLITFSV